MSTPDTEKINVFFAVLDWGLGHASRSIPLINKLIDRNIEVILGGSGASLRMLKMEFPQLETVELPGYGFSYPLKAWCLPLKVIARIPAFLRAATQEREILKRMVMDERIQGVISDNRYGLWMPGLPSRIIIHQLNPRLPLWMLPFRGLLHHLHNRLLRPFGSCWVPDERDHTYAGALSVPHKKNLKTEYLGPLSRLKSTGSAAPTYHYDLLVLLSGPEPQRSLLETKVLKQCVGQDWKVVLVRGLPGGAGKISSPPNVVMLPYANEETIGNLLTGSRVILCRSGYSTLMDLAVVGCRLILVPTPGQTEQEYLAQWWAEKGRALEVKQADLDLPFLMENARHLPVLQVLPPSANLDGPLDHFLAEIRSARTQASAMPLSR